MEIIFFINTFTTFYMLGIIWFVQVVHYPLFSFASKESFPEFARQHSRFATYVVVGPMIVELFTSFLLIFKSSSELKYLFVAGFFLVLFIWVSTFILQVPQHKKLGNGYDENSHRVLVTSNWIRTACWSLRSLLNLYLINLIFL